ncbi:MULTISPECIES: deoxyribodipyrimidine photo-lyase [unclassified Polaromonas]|uniref:cryptochrome/photolyase family protein n=1 Tax=unclassified Polaromonas TaxID=2638319 RepID=UPI0018C9B7A4|nr:MULTISPECIES: deoxyribodipyrimidine photo-lyase [unclassified Polaromonas]MBG6070964.1 deoxyribodipyrimidine photo-lyase [Polaromonas sp. CG_9.7]MBG6112726.1 deoxyribodipyrimidine photo-lyase [Polaromonas sp. CG_9.2]MDH6186201.1 deoxyribodipyrimidine photo-lyase [Polaromonas sp. CG_23.6]
MHKKYKTGLMWFRRDLRTEDNAALYHALKSCEQVYCAFVFDKSILDALPRADRRVEFIRESLVDLNGQLAQLCTNEAAAPASLLVRHDAASTALPALAQQLSADAVFSNHDDEPYSLARDARVQAVLEGQGVAFHTFKDHVIFERQEVLTLAGKPYSVFTPYKNAWLKKVDAFYLKPYQVEAYSAALAPLPASEAREVPSLAELGFEVTNFSTLKLPAGSQGGNALLEDFLGRMEKYRETRDFPAVRGPSYLSVHLRFGTVSIRKLASVAMAHQTGNEGAATWLSELIWRDFYAQVLANYPHVVGSAFKPEYDAIQWEQGEKAQSLFVAWCEGRTGYPLVDAAMAQINQTGYMHNRLRMVTASFLVKDLGIDWRWGERYFAENLNDFDLASNNGGWQWAASTGCDAQPYFRIFNPVSQSEKFDVDGKFIRKYLPALARLPKAAVHNPWLASPVELMAADVALGGNYPMPLVDHAKARSQTLDRYAVVKKA